MEKERKSYKVFLWADSVQIIQIVIDPGQTIPAGAVFDKWIDEGITCERQEERNVNPAHGVFGKLLDSGRKKLNRAPHAVIYFTNPGSSSKNIAFAAPGDRQILPIHLHEQDGNFFCHKEAFICAESAIEMISHSGSKAKSNLKGLGKSDWLEFRGDGIIFVHVGGTFRNKQLINQRLKLDRRSIVGFAGGITADRQIAGAARLNRSDIKAYFQVKLSGSGTVYLQSKPFKMPKHAQSLTRDIGELLNSKALGLYKGNLKKIKSFQWSSLQNRIKTDILQNTLKITNILPGKTKKLTAKKG
jgi:uncharacterized protein (AIM24 family)